MKYTPVWLEAFILYAVLWSFGSVMNDIGRKELDAKLKERIHENKMEFTVFQKLRKK